MTDFDVAFGQARISGPAFNKNPRGPCKFHELETAYNALLDDRDRRRIIVDHATLVAHPNCRPETYDAAIFVRRWEEIKSALEEAESLLIEKERELAEVKGLVSSPRDAFLDSLSLSLFQHEKIPEMRQLLDEYVRLRDVVFNAWKSERLAVIHDTVHKIEQLKLERACYRQMFLSGIQELLKSEGDDGGQVPKDGTTTCTVCFGVRTHVLRGVCEALQREEPVSRVSRPS